MSEFLVTGFGPFGEVVENPSGSLAASCGLPYELLDVSFDAVEAFLAALDPASFDRLLLIGVAPKADKMRVELVARNAIGKTPDVTANVQGPCPIDPAAPFQLGGTLWRDPDLFQETEERLPSIDAGNYLCNYIYFRALQVFPDKEVGFLHVPPVDKIPLDVQRRELEDLITGISER